MWNAFGNGSGLHVGSGGGGGGGGGGYVPAQGWEFVPRSRLEKSDRGRGKNRSPLRRISSPPSICQIFEPPPQPGAGGGTLFEGTRGQFWPGTGPEFAAQLKQQQQQQQQAQQHGQLKKKIEDLKRRHGQDKEEWMREKEILLRQVADIQGGENRRILLDLKAVLDEVQTEVKREEEKRSDLQLLYTKDRCAWELEKAELKCRIAQLEVREGVGAGQPVGARSSLAPPYGSETTSLRRDREEQRRLLVDTHTAAMDLRCRLDHNERGWVRERSELLERFDSERKEWESQLRDMQRKIEELYSEVRTRREGGGGGGDSGTQDEDDVALRLSLHSSSLLSSQSRSFSHPDSRRSSQSEGLGPPTPVLNRGGTRTPRCHGNNSFEEVPPCVQDVAGDSERAFPPIGRDQAVAVDNQEAADTRELEVFLHRVVGLGAPRRDSTSSKRRVDDDSLTPQGPRGVPTATPQTAELNYGTGSEKKKNTTALNAALKEIARVSEELCSYQDEIRKKAGGNRTDSLYFSEENEKLLGRFKNRLEINEPACDLNQIYDDLRALERENWISWSPVNTLTANSKPAESWRANSDDPNTKLPESESPAPPVPPRTSSWYRSSPTPSEHEQGLRVPEYFAGRKCHSPCPLWDRKSSSPSIVRKFEAMLQENEGKVLAGAGAACCQAPASSKCHAGCCHNRRSCQGLGPARPSPDAPVQKSLSECNIPNAGKHASSSSSGCVGGPGAAGKDMPVDLLLPSLDLEAPRAQRHPPAPPAPPGRNLLLEQKTAEFHRTLFQAGTGRGLEDAPPVGTATPPPPSGRVARQDATCDLLSQCAEAAPDVGAALVPEVSEPGRASASDLSPPLQEVQTANQQSVRKGQDGRRREVAPPDLSPRRSPQGRCLREVLCPSPNGSSRPQQPGVRAWQAGQAEPGLPAGPRSSQSSVPWDRIQEERMHTAKPQVPPAQEPAPELRSSHPSPPGRSAAPSTQPDPPRPGPRVLADHPWKPLTLAAYPRPAEARSNYGAVERILKSYEESAAWTRQNRENRARSPSPGPQAHGGRPSPGPQAHGGRPSPAFSRQQQEEELVGLMDVLDTDPPLSLLPGGRHTTHTSAHASSSHAHAAASSSSSSSFSHTHLLQTSVAHAQTSVTVKESKASSSVISSSSSSVQKNFSRPACPANRRLPSRWASRSPSSCSSSSPSSSPSSTPVTRPSVSPQPKHALSAFTSYSSAYQTETIII